MEHEQALRRIVRTLRDLQVEYMICDSVASSHYGEPRATHDIDVVIDIDVDRLRELLKRLGTDYYWNESTAIESLANRTMFNVIDFNSGVKVDFVILKEDAFDQTEFQRRREQNLAGEPVSLISPQDAVISKLIWHSISNSDRQLDDVRGILATQKSSIDFEYLQYWAEELSVATTLTAIRAGVSLD